MKLPCSINAFPARLTGITLLAFMLSHCASYAPDSDTTPTQKKDTPAEVIPHEGGIVGTGNESDCSNKRDKARCNDNIK